MTQPNNSLPAIDLTGKWKFSLGENRPAGFGQSINLPGSLQEQGFGNDVTPETEWTGSVLNRAWFDEEQYERYRQPGNVKISFWLQPDRHYVGSAWYEREIEIPEEWNGRRVVLSLERVHIQSTVWLDGREIGSQNSLGAPHVYDLGLDVAPGKHVLALQIDNRLHVDVGCESHSVSDHTQTNWNGVIGRIELKATSPVWIEDAQAYPNVADRSVRLRVRIGNATGKAGSGRLTAGDQETDVSWTAEGGEVEITCRLNKNSKPWDEFSPVVHTVTLRLSSRGVDDTREVAFGFRELAVEGTRITINGRKIFLRGTLECAVFPKTGFPPTDLDSWRHILKTIRDYGFNHVRFHSWCPPEAAFAAGDELGLYFQVECSSWANRSVTLGDGLPVDQWLYEEARAIIKAYGNHPSFLLMAYGNEPGGDRHADYLAKWVGHWKKEEPRRLHTSGAGWPPIPENQYDNTPEPRVQGWGEQTTSRINLLPPATTADYALFVTERPRPIVSHEIGQWCVYPDFTEIPKYTGFLKAKNFEIFKDSLEANHMGGQARDFLHASGRLQILCYREDIESALRTHGFGGFQILQVNDFPGQGTALVGWLNPFWESKGYATPEEFRRFNNSTVLLARLEKRVFSSRDKLRAEIEVAHFEAEPMADARPCWKLMDESGVVHASGELPRKTLPVDNGIALGTVELELRDLPAPAKYRLVVGIAGTAFENDWEIWVYPANRISLQRPGSSVRVHLVRDLDVLLRFAEKEERVFFIPSGDAFRDKVKMGFSPIFWNTAWTRGQAPHTLGILCDPSHPVFAEFPTESGSNWQWWEILHGASALRLDALPAGFQPIVQVIDDWFTNRRLGLLYEARLGKCSVMVSGAELMGSISCRHAARQFRHGIFDYMATPAFAPRQEIDEKLLKSTLGYSRE